MTGSPADLSLCIIPARGGSRRFPRKNLASFGGHPLAGQAILAAKAAGIFRTVCVSSEDDEVLSVAEQYGADLVLKRDAELARYERQVKDVCGSVIQELATDGDHYPTFAVLLPTSPLRTPEDIRAAHDVLLESGADCCMSLVTCEHPPQRALALRDGHVEAYFGDQYLKPAQSLETLYRHDGTVLFARTESFLREGSFYGGHVVPYIVSRERSVDIDHPLDLAWAEFLAARQWQ